MLSLPEQAAHVAEIHLAQSLPRRWHHVKAVAAKARQLGRLTGSDVDALVASAWVHDIGYAPGVTGTGFHALDGARWLLGHGFGERIAGLVAHHSCACYEAEERGLSEALAKEFKDEETVTSDALWFADMTTGPDGQDLTVEQRLAEIRTRYGPDHLVTRFWKKAEGPLLESIRRTKTRLADHPM